MEMRQSLVRSIAQDTTYRVEMVLCAAMEEAGAAGAAMAAPLFS